jgi:hypothetical protein
MVFQDKKGGMALAFQRGILTFARQIKDEKNRMTL